jgi:hypothetical protein
MESLVNLSLSRFRKEMEAASTESQLEDIRDQLAQLKALRESSFSEEIKRLDGDLIDKMEKILVDKIKFYVDRNLLDDATINIGEYKTKYPNGKQAGLVEEMASALSDKREKSARRQVNDITLAKRPKAEWPSFLEDKAKAVEAYVGKNDNGLDNQTKEDMRKAVELARYLATHSDFDVIVKGVNGLGKAQVTYLKIKVSGKNDFSLETYPQNSKNPSWNKSWKIRWEPGSSVLIEWYRDDYVSDDLMARLSDDGIWSLGNLDGDVHLATERDWEDAMTQDPAVAFALVGKAGSEERRFVANDWEILKRYIHPGEEWQQ